MFELIDLPYAQNALEPIISKETVQVHYEGHHKGYVDKLNSLMPENKDELIFVIKKTSEKKDKSMTTLFNNAAQIWNHDFYWHSLCPYQSTSFNKNSALYKKLILQYGSVENFFKEFIEKAVGQFGSGWAFLVKKKDASLAIVTTGNADVPFLDGDIPLLTCDVWEHAYYLDYKNKRAAYVEGVVKNLWNWTFAEKIYEENTLFGQ